MPAPFARTPVSHVGFSCTVGYKRWLGSFAAATKAEVSTLISRAMQDYAVARGYPPPPARLSKRRRRCFGVRKPKAARAG